MSRQASDHVVDLVNPKFKQYNRPLLLAVVIGGFTLIFVAILTYQAMQICTVVSIPLAGVYSLGKVLGGNVKGGGCCDKTWAEEEFIQEKEPIFDGCIISVQHTRPVTNTVQCKSFVEKDKMHSGFPDFLIKDRWCDPEIQTELAPPNADDVWGRGQVDEENPGKIGEDCREKWMPEELKDGVWTKGLPPAISNCDKYIMGCERLHNSEFIFNPEAILTRSCPSLGVTLGAMLGYAGLIELALTVAILLPFMAFGCIESGKNSVQARDMKGWLRELANEGDGGQELADNLT